jgi:phospholipid/cholesterol/gamma-HCH transport system substrate-binding protein
MKNEVKVGILGICSALSLFWGYNFLKGKNTFSSNIILNASFENVEGLQIAAPVTINGYRVGAVTNIYLGKEAGNQGRVIAELTLSGSTQVPKNDSSAAVLITPSIMSGKTIELKFTGTCQGAGCFQSGDNIKGRAAGIFDAVKPIVDPYMEKIDSVSKMWADIAQQEKGSFKQSMADIQATIANLKTISDQVNNLMVSSSVNIAVTVSNLKEITGNIKSNNEEITAMLKNMNAVTKQVKDGQIDKLLQQSTATMDAMQKTINELQNTLKKTNSVMEQVQALANLKDKDGLISTLLYDKAFAQELQITINDAKLLMKDIRLHPERYRTVLSGKKKKYVPDPNDPAYMIDTTTTKKGGL